MPAGFAANYDGVLRRVFRTSGNTRQYVCSNYHHGRHECPSGASAGPRSSQIWHDFVCIQFPTAHVYTSKRQPAGPRDRSSQRLLSVLSTNNLSGYHLLPRFQSAYRRGHFTETALLKVFSDVVNAIDSGQLALLSLLDMSAAFDT